MSHTFESGKMSKKTMGILTGVLSVLAFIVAALVARYVVTTVLMPSKSEQVEQAVVDTKKQLSIPQKIDANTTLTDVVAEGEVIRYQYTIAGIDPKQITEERLKQTVAPTACANDDVRKLLDGDINLRYSYVVSETKDTYDFTVTKADC